MEELKEFCDVGLPITLSPEWEEFDIAKKLLLEAYDYQEDPESEDPNTFIKVRPLPSYLDSGIAEEKIIFPDIIPQAEIARVCRAEYKRPSGDRNRPQKVSDPNWKRTMLAEFDTTKLPEDEQTILLPPIPTKQQIVQKQKVRILVSVQPHVKTEDANLLIHLQPKLLSVGVIPKAVTFVKDFSLGYYPSFIRLSLQPRFADSSTVALPLYTPKDSLHPNSAAGVLDSYRRTTGTKLGGQLGWGPISFSAEQSWGTEREITHEFQRLVPVNHDEGNAASFEWQVLRWSDGDKYNASKPHSGFFRKTLRPPFAGGTSTHVRIEGFPGVLWHLDPQLEGPVVFHLHLEVEMHLIWFLGTKPFFKSPGSDSKSFEFRSQFEVQL